MEEYFDKGRQCMDKGDFEGAAKEFTTGIEKNPKASQYYLFRGICNFRVRKPEQALEDFTYVITNLGEDAPEMIKMQTLFHRGNTFLLLKQEKKAIEDFTAYLEINPNPMVFLTRAQVYLDLEEYEKAITDCNEVLKKLPHKPPSVLYLRSFSYFKNGEFEKCIEDCKAITEMGGSFSATMLYGFSLLRMKNTNQGFFQLGKAFQILKEKPARFVDEVNEIVKGLFQNELKEFPPEISKDLEVILAEIVETVKGVEPERGGCCGGGCGCGPKEKGGH